MDRGARRIVWLGVLVAVTLGIQGCREDEQDRVLLYEPGVYQGAPDEALAEETVRELRGRARGQRF